MVLKHLRLLADQWDALPWWQRQMYMEELTADLKRMAGEVEPPSEGEVEDLPDIADLGFNVRRAGG